MPLDMNRSRMLLASRSTTTLHFAPSISIGVRFLHKAAKVYIHMSISTCSKQQRGESSERRMARQNTDGRGVAATLLNTTLAER